MPGSRSRGGWPRAVALLLSAIPLAFLVVLFVLAPALGEGTFEKPPEILGVPLGVAPLALGVLLGGLGVYLVSEADGPGRTALVLLLCTAPATALVLVAPAVGRALATAP